MKGKPGVRAQKKTPLGTRIGKTAREARLRLKLTQADMAERVGIAVEVYGKMERGYMLPSAPTLRKLCAALGVKADTLLGLASEFADADAAQAQAEARDEMPMPPETRRLLRTVRTLNRLQLSVFSGVARGFLKLKNQQQQHDEAQDVAT